MTPRHRSEEFRRFLNLIDKSVPDHLHVHVVLDNQSAHKTPSIQRWLVRYPRFHLYFTPTDSSWLNLGRALVRRAHQQMATARHPPVRASPHCVDRTWITNWNDDPKPFVWHKPPTRSSTASPPTANGSPTHATRCREVPGGSGRRGPLNPRACWPTAGWGSSRPAAQRHPSMALPEGLSAGAPRTAASSRAARPGHRQPFDDEQ
jgi:DDE superfamily endonuclease